MHVGHLSGSEPERCFLGKILESWHAMKSCRLFLLAAVLVLPACAQNLQNQIDEQGRAISLLQRKNLELDRSLRRLRDDYQSDIERLRYEIKSMRVTAEQKQPWPEADQGAPAAGEGPMVPAPQQPAAQPPAPSDRDMYNQAYGIYSSGDYGRARGSFADFIKAHPASSLVSNAQYWIASSYFKEAKFEEAISACDDVIKKYPQSSKTPDAYYLQALSFVEIKDPTTAQIILEDLIQKFPSSEAATAGRQKYEVLKGQ